MSSKEEHATMLSTEHARAAKQDYILKGPPAMTFSAMHPAYSYTSLCPDPELREPQKQWLEHTNGILQTGKVMKIPFRRLSDYEEIKHRLSVICQNADILIKIIEEESCDYERRMAFMETTYQEICTGADYSGCKNIDDMAKVYTGSLLKRLGY